LNSGPCSDIRALDSGQGELGLPGLRPRLLKPFRIISNISKA
jgi:hypothetical protein